MKRIYALILAVVMTISLFGCERGNDPVGTTEPTVETTVATTEATEAPVETTEAPTEAPTTVPTEATEAPTVAPTVTPTEPVKPTEATVAPTEPVETQHTHSYTSKTTAATCESKGYTTYTCACGHSYTGDETKATGHNYSKKHVAPTCGSGGYDKYTCSACGNHFAEPTGEAPTEQHNYTTTTTVAPTATEDGYDLHKCANCGKEYKDNYVSKTNSESGLAHEGMYWSTTYNRWEAHDCASEGHVFMGKDYVILQEQTCYQVEIKECHCAVVGCNAIDRIKGPDNMYGYSYHTRNANEITGYYYRYVTRRADGRMWNFRNEADARTKAKEIDSAYQNGECEYGLVDIWCDKQWIVPEQYNCTVCGKTCDGTDYYWNDGTPYAIDVWNEMYDETSGCLTGKLIYEDNGKRNTSCTTYDENGNIIKIKHFD